MLRLIEELSMNAWPALQTVLYDGWVLRFANGYTRRANSVNPLYSSAEEIDRKIAYCENLYHANNLNVVFKMTSRVFPENLDKWLLTKGYTDDSYASVQVIKLDKGIPKTLTQSFTITHFVTENWLTDFGRLDNSGADTKLTFKRMLENIIHQKCFISLQIEDKVIACGRGVLENDFLGLFDIVVDTSYRNQGYGKQLMLNLLKWGQIYGAKTAYLQVMLDNLPALKLYSKLGFREIYQYWYRVES